jgi:hypothetical protein
MLLKDSNTSRAFFKNSLNFLIKKKVLAGVVLLTLYTLLILATGYILKKNNFYGGILKPVLLKNYKGAVNYLNSFSADPEKIIIDIKHQDYLKLAFQRQEALKNQSLFFAAGEGWIPATLTNRGKTIRTDVRLKGSNAPHWEDDRAWSLKFKIKDGDTLFGMKRFALQGVWNRGFMNAWYWNKLLRYCGLISLRYDFVDVTLNGNHFPVYAIEENFEKQLLYNNNLREGPIFWANLAPLKSLKAIGFYQSKKYEKNLEYMKMVQTAENQIEAFREGVLPLSKVFDINKIAKLVALMGLVGEYHSLQHGQGRSGVLHPRSRLLIPTRSEILGWSGTAQARWYLNPITGLIEPIAYDNNGIKMDVLIGLGRRFINHQNRNSDWIWPIVLFHDKLFFKKYIESLEEFSDKIFLDRFFSEIEEEEHKRLNLLHRSYPFYELDRKADYYKNRREIKKQLHPTKSLIAYFDGVSKGERILNLDITNIHGFPIEILGVTLDDINIITPLKESIVQANQKVGDIEHWHFLAPVKSESLWRNTKKSILKEIRTLANFLPMVSETETQLNQNQLNLETPGLQYEKIKFQLPEELKWSDNLIPRLRLISRVYGARSKNSTTIIPWPRHEEMFVQPNNLKNISFISVEEENKLIRIKQGKWVVNQDIVIPRGYTLIADSGTHLNLINGAKILSYSAVKFIGSKARPIVISAEGSGQGIAVLEAKDRSILQYVNFKKLTNPNKAGWMLTGAVTFYESPVTFTNVEFINSQAEDALNIVRSEFTLENIIFRNSLSDAFDSDFSHGVIKNTSFFNSGNDALDSSRSEILVENIFLDGTGDKGISAGEKSRIVLDKLESINSRIGVASKDQSEIVIQHAVVTNSKIGFAAFQKKPEFGPGTIEVHNLKISASETNYLVERGSTLIVEGFQIEPQAENVAKLLYRD